MGRKRFGTVLSNEFGSDRDGIFSRAFDPRRFGTICREDASPFRRIRIRPLDRRDKRDGRMGRFYRIFKRFLPSFLYARRGNRLEIEFFFLESGFCDRGRIGLFGIRIYPSAISQGRFVYFDPKRKVPSRDETHRYERSRRFSTSESSDRTYPFQTRSVSGVPFRMGKRRSSDLLTGEFSRSSRKVWELLRNFSERTLNLWELLQNFFLRPDFFLAKPSIIG